MAVAMTSVVQRRKNSSKGPLSAISLHSLPTAGINALCCSWLFVNPTDEAPRNQSAA